MNTKLLLLALAGILALAVGATASARTARSTIDPSRFSTRIDNPWFPLVPGTTYVYAGVDGDMRSRDVVTVTHGTVSVTGIRCRVVRDLLYHDGRLAERTTDWYAQERSGDVWYFGEQTAELDAKGRVTSTEGSWQAGVSGARAGIIMLAHPRVGKAYQQEFFKGHAEDFARVIGLFRGVAGSTSGTMLLTAEWTPLEPGVLDHKLYVRGLGDVVERTVKGGNEYLELQSVRRS